MTGGRNPLDRLAESFVERYRRGEDPSVEAWAREHPELAAEIRSLFPTLTLMEELRPDEDPAEGAEASRGVLVAGPVRTPGRVGPYDVRRVLGRGGMGTVYEAVAGEGAPLPEGGRFALKIIHPHLAGEGAFLERFLREADLGRRVDHPNVVRTLDVGLHEDDQGLEMPYLVLEHVEGRSLLDLARSLGGSLPEALIRHVARQIVEGLAAVHACGIVHRDVKPSNVMITEDHRVLLMDLGVARLDDPSGRLSSTGQFVGSVRYAAPEQFRSRGNDLGPATDLYALGVTLYELATGRHPFRATSPHALMLAHLNEAAPSARSHRPELSPFLTQLLGVLLEKDPARRFSDAAALGTVLARAEASTWWSRRRLGPVLARPPVARDARFVGRDEELRRLDAAWAEARDGAGRCVLLRGEAGVGKSAIADAFVGRLEGLNVRVLYGSFPPGDGPDGLRDAVVDAYGRAGLEDALNGHLGAHPMLVPAFRAFLLREPPPADAAPLDRHTLGTLFARLVAALARERPLVWVVDDLQFASPRAVAAFFAMLRVLPGERALLVGTSRSALPGPWIQAFAGASHAEEIRVERLPEETTREIVEGALGTSPRLQDLVDRVVRDSGGNPFFLRAMLQEIARLQKSAGAGGFSSEAIRAVPVPEAIRDLVDVRLDALEEAERRILECGAVQGFSFDAELVSAALGLDALTVLQTLGAVERRTGIVRSVGADYRFDHHQLQEVLLDQVAPPLAQAYHRHLAEAVARRNGWTEATPPTDDVSPDAILLVRHALEGGAWELAVPVVLPVLVAIRTRLAVDLALKLCDRALELATAGRAEAVRTIAQLRVERLGLLGAIGRTADQVEESALAVDAAERTGDLLLRSEACRLRGTSLAMIGRHDDGLTWLGRALEFAGEAGDSALEHAAVLNLASVQGWSGRHEEAIETALRGLAIARQGAHPLREARAHFSAGHYLTYAGRHDEAMEHLLAAARLTADDESYAAKGFRVGLLGVTGNVHFAQGRYTEASVCYEESLELCRRLGDRRAGVSNMSNLAGVALARGRLDEAISFYRDGVAVGAELGEENVWVGTIVNLGGGLLTTGQLEEAVAWLERGLALTVKRGLKRLHGYAQHDLARIDWLRGDGESALRRVEEALSIRVDLGREGVAETHLLLAELAEARKDTERALEHLGQAVSVADATGAAGVGARALWRRAALAREAPEAREIPATASALERAEILLLQSTALEEPSRRERARAVLEEVTASLADAADREAFRRHGPAWRLYGEAHPD